MKKRNTIIIWIIVALLIIAGVTVPLYFVGKNNSTIAWMGKTPLPVSGYKYYLFQFVNQLESSRSLTSADLTTKSQFWTTQLDDGTTYADYYKQVALTQYKKIMISVLKAKAAGISVPQEVKDQYNTSFTNLINTQFSGKRIDADKAAIAELGVNIDQFKQLLYDQYLAQQFEDKYYKDAVARLLPDVTVADAQAKYDEDPTVYNTYTVAHILLLTVDPSTMQSLPDADVTAAQTKATELLTKITNGEDLGALAAQYSQDSGTKDIGGVFAFNKLSLKIDPNIISWAPTAVIGEAKIVQTQSGFSIIRLDKNETTAFDTITDDIRNEIAAGKAEAEITAFADDAKYTLKTNTTVMNKISVIR